jgi:hypothetical protein
MVNNSSSRMDATPNNNTIKKTTTPTWLFWNLEFIFEKLVNFHFKNGIYSSFIQVQMGYKELLYGT